MVIQRIQTVWLLLAVACLVAFCCLPIANVEQVIEMGGETAAKVMMPVYPLHFIAFFVVCILSALLQFVAIFMFKNMKRQKTVVAISMALAFALIVTQFIIMVLCMPTYGAFAWTASIALLVANIIFAGLAFRSISSDERLLRAADRLR